MIDSKRLSLGVILTSATLTIMAGSIIAPVLNVMRDGLGVDPSSVGLIITTHGLFMALFSPLMGSVIDRKGARWPFIFSLIGYGLAGGSGLLINSYWVLLVSRACLGIALAGIFAAINVLILSMYEGGDRDRAMGWRGSAQSFGGVIWPLIGGALGGFSWHFPFAVYMLAIPIGLFAMRVVPEQVTHHLTGPSFDNGTTVFKLFRQNPILLMIIYGLMFFANVLLYVIIIFLPQLLETCGISSTFRIGMFLTAMTGAAGVTAFIYGKIRSRFSYPAIVLTAVAIWSVAFAIISRASDSRIIAVSIALFGVSQGLILPTIMVWIGDVVPSSFRGRFSSYLGTFGFIGQFLSPILFAPILIMMGLKGVFMVGAGIGVAWFFLCLFGLRHVNSD
ncbi:MAG: MFS transporter [Desulfobacterales bacterium]|nr:MFS transporter [Desulfobacterales bacterium]MDD4071787.1 MFS transporter [Desulfobacterales bacterium]MDD4393674.1 MFS transporter [Desulfobacterales bacterium]